MAQQRAHADSDDDRVEHDEPDDEHSPARILAAALLNQREAKLRSYRQSSSQSIPAVIASIEASAHSSVPRI